MMKPFIAGTGKKKTGKSEYEIADRFGSRLLSQN
ncbi:hypothetical protein ACVW0P_000406 [Mucilaginibacter sp. UYNi724]